MSDSGLKKAAVEASLSHSAQPERASLAELKNGKVVFKQKAVSFEKQSETLQDIVKFRHMLQARLDQQLPPLESIPEEHRPLIAKLAHESDKSLASLSKYVMQELLPTEDEDGSTSNFASTALPLTIVENCIKLTLARNNYGLDAMNGVKPPAAVCIWRWEVKEHFLDWLPKNAREKAELRLAERLQAKQDLKVIFDALSKEEQEALFGHKASGKALVNRVNKSSVVGDQATTNGEVGSPAASQTPKKSNDVGNESQPETPPQKTDKGPKNPERVVKEKERLQKKAAKAEKEKKEKDAELKSRSVMANFLSKPKLNSRAVSKESEPPIAGPSKFQRDFDKHFKPFVLRKDTVLAPINWFHEVKKKPPMTSKEVITIDVDEDRPSMEDVEMRNIQITQDISELNAQERLQSILFSQLPSPGPSRTPRPCQNFFRTYPTINVRDMVMQLSEAEISGDTSMVRNILAKLRDRSLLPAKVFIFHEDARPGYFGTWTRNSRVIRPRQPFAKDMLAFDYGYDSGEEWEEEAVGDADDVLDEGEDEDAGDEDADSDLDSWLVDDDDEPDVPDNRDLTPPVFDFPVHLPPKRKAEDGEKKIGKKRKVIVPLVPFTKGPCWEATVGHIEYEPFKPYQIQLFNDTPFPIDPFSFVSTCMEDKRASERLGMNGGSIVHATGTIFAVPSLPERLANSTSTNVPLVPTTSTVASKRAAMLKSTFPDVHMPFLLQKINELQAPSIILLVEAIYQELRVHKVKKNAIEAKVREVSEKCKEQRFWIVKKQLSTIVVDKP